jgi:hypothetical protein
VIGVEVVQLGCGATTTAGGIKLIFICLADIAHCCGNACSLILTSGAAIVVRGLESPGLQSCSADAQVALQVATPHHAHVCAKWHPP